MPYPPRHMVRIVMVVLAAILLFLVSTLYDSVSMTRFAAGPSMSQQERLDLVEKLQELKHILAEYFPIDAKE